jgi:hypothetical protein
MECPSYATELSHLLKAEIHPSDILALEETDSFLSIHHAQAGRSAKEKGFAFKKTWRYKPLATWTNLCRELGEKLCEVPAVLFVGPYEFCGGVKVKAGRALNAAPSLLEFDRDTVTLQSFSMESGLFLDLFEENSEWFVELAVWGAWKVLAEELGPFPEGNHNEHC